MKYEVRLKSHVMELRETCLNIFAMIIFSFVL